MIDYLMKTVYEFAQENNFQLYITDEAGGLSNRAGFEEYIFKNYKSLSTTPEELENPPTLQPNYQYTVNKIYLTLPLEQTPLKNKEIKDVEKATIPTKIVEETQQSTVMGIPRALPMLSILPTVVIVTEWIGEKTGLIPEQSPAPLEEFIEEEIVEKESVNVREVTVVADDAKSSVEVKIDVDYDPILAGVVEEAVEDVAYENDKKLREQKRKSRECGPGGSIDCSLKNVKDPSKKAPDIKKAAENAVKQAKPQVEEQQPKVVLPYELDEYVNRLFIEEVRKGIFRRKESIKLDDKEFTKAQVVEQFKKAIQTGNSAHVTRSGGLRNDFEKITKSEELLKRLKQDVRQAAYKDGDFKKARGLINLEIGRGVIKKQVLDEMLKVLDQVEKALAPKKAELLMVARSEIKEENKIGEGDWGKVYDYKGGAAKLALDESYVDFLVEDGEVILSLTGLDGVPKFLGWVFDEKG